MAGKKNWYFADGYLPEKVNNGEMEAHEALMLFNTSETAAEVVIDIYYSDRVAKRPKNVRLRVEGKFFLGYLTIAQKMSVEG